MGVVGRQISKQNFGTVGWKEEESYVGRQGINVHYIDRNSMLSASS
jgi:hypothetical protein